MKTISKFLVGITACLTLQLTTAFVNPTQPVTNPTSKPTIAVTKPVVVVPEGIVLVTAVHDGDTVTILTTDNKKFNVRLLAIDSPEVSQSPYGMEARDYLRLLVLNKHITLKYERLKVDFHGRLLAYLITESGLVANVEMVKSGNAVVYMLRNYYVYHKAFVDASLFAKQNHLGVFYRNTNPLKILPEDYRRQLRTKITVK